MATPTTQSPRPSSPVRPAGPRIGLDVLDAPQQRLYLASLFLLFTGLKLHSFLVPQSAPPIWTLLVPRAVNNASDYELARWVVLDVGFVVLVRWLRVPRLAWGTLAASLVGLGLILLDYGLFGRWEVGRRVRGPSPSGVGCLWWFRGGKVESHSSEANLDVLVRRS